MKKTIRNTVLAALLLASVSPVLADDEDLRAEADKAIKALQNADSGLANYFSRAAGYAVFPSVGKGGLIFGAEHGNGIVYEQGKAIGKARLSEINFGPQMGGETFDEVIFFETSDAVQHFKEGHFEVSAKVAATTGAAGAAL